MDRGIISGEQSEPLKSATISLALSNYLHIFLELSSKFKPPVPSSHHISKPFQNWYIGPLRSFWSRTYHSFLSNDFNTTQQTGVICNNSSRSFHGPRLFSLPDSSLKWSKFIQISINTYFPHFIKQPKYHGGKPRFSQICNKPRRQNGRTHRRTLRNPPIKINNLSSRLEDTAFKFPITPKMAPSSAP